MDLSCNNLTTLPVRMFFFFKIMLITDQPDKKLSFKFVNSRSEAPFSSENRIKNPLEIPKEIFNFNVEFIELLLFVNLHYF